MACYYSGLHNVIHKLWAWCQLDVNLMTSSLALLATYVAHCPTGNVHLVCLTENNINIESSSITYVNQLPYCTTLFLERVFGT